MRKPQKALKRTEVESWRQVRNIGEDMTCYDRVMTRAYMTANVMASLVFIDDVTAYRSIRMNSEVYNTILSSHFRPNATKLKRWCFTVQMDNYPKTAKTTQQLIFEGKRLNML